MIRLLVIGRGASDWGARLLSLAPEITIDTARLPAAGIRQLAQTPPDAVFIVESSNAARATALVEAVRSQPLGAFTPIVVHGEALDPTLDVQAKLASDDGPSEVLKAIEGALELELGELTAGADAVVTMETSRQPTRENPAVSKETTRPLEPPSEGGPARIETPKFVLEEIVDDEPQGPRQLEHRDLFPARGPTRRESDVDEATVKRMLRAVRHEDYFSILGVHRGAETPAIRDAYYRQLERFDDRNVDIDIAHRRHMELDEIRDALEDAWAVLGDSDLRTDYLESTTRT